MALLGKLMQAGGLLYSGIIYIVNLPEPPQGRVLLHIAAGAGVFLAGWLVARGTGR